MRIGRALVEATGKLASTQLLDHSVEKSLGDFLTVEHHWFLEEPDGMYPSAVASADVAHRVRRLETSADELANLIIAELGIVVEDYSVYKVR